jgi:hypothetical protein
MENVAMKTSQLTLLALAASSVLSLGPALANDGRLSPGMGGGVVLPPIIRPTATTTTPTPATVTLIPLNYTKSCSGGGTRTTAGSWDTVAGNLDVSTTYTGCVVSYSGEKQDGSSRVHGTLALAGGASGLNINLTFTDNLTVTRSDGSNVTYTCNRTKNGSFDQTTWTFNGTSTTSACSTTGKVRDFEGIAEYLLREYAVLTGTALPMPNVFGR